MTGANGRRRAQRRTCSWWMASRCRSNWRRQAAESIGTPALIPMLKLAHEQHGRLPWAQLFEPAIRLAEEGFVVGPRLSRSLASNRTMFEGDPEARAIYLDAAGKPWPQGHVLKNPAYGKTLRAIAAEGPRALTQGRLRRRSWRRRSASRARGR